MDAKDFLFIYDKDGEIDFLVHRDAITTIHFYNPYFEIKTTDSRSFVTRFCPELEKLREELKSE